MKGRAADLVLACKRQIRKAKSLRVLLPPLLHKYRMYVAVTALLCAAYLLPSRVSHPSTSPARDASAASASTTTTTSTATDAGRPLSESGNGGADPGGGSAQRRRRYLSATPDPDLPWPEWATDVPRLTMFCAPKPYTQSPGDPQRRALLSWLRLQPPPKIVLLGNDPSFERLAEEFPGRVSVESNIDYNFYGVPLFHSMLARAQAADTPLSMLINGDIILLNDAMAAIGRLHDYFEDFLITAARWDVDKDFPFSFEPEAWRKATEEEGKSERAREREIQEYVRRHGSLHTYGGVDLWLWNNSPTPLFSGPMPPFAFGRGKYDNWLTHEAVAAGLRQVVDASSAFVSIHVLHSYEHVHTAAATAASAGGGSGGGKGGGKGSFWSTRKKSSWELYANIHMAETWGSYTNQKGTSLHCPWSLTNCVDPDSLNICLLKRERPANCTCEYSAYAMKTQSDPRLHHSGDYYMCGVVSVDKKSDFKINPVAQPNSTVGLPHTMEQLLPLLARAVDDSSGRLHVVTLVAVTFGYAEMLMNFVCNLRTLGLADNLIVAALDEDLYRFAFLQGLAVYYERPSIDMKSFDKSQCQFGTQCFRQFTKLKSRAVLRVLKAGYSVLWTDVDIVWFNDPLPDLMSYGPGTFPIQSNEPNATLPGTGIRRINSGFYFARADKMTVKAFEAIVAHAAMTKLSEQPSFYDVLCGEKGELLVKGGAEEACLWTNGLKTIFLNRRVYPNGAVFGFWKAANVSVACRGCSILHNNWISGKDAKKDRLVANRFWYYDVERRMCKHLWHDRLPKPPSPPAAQTPAGVEGKAGQQGKAGEDAQVVQERQQVQQQQQQQQQQEQQEQDQGQGPVQEQQQQQQLQEQ